MWVVESFTTFRVTWHIFLSHVICEHEKGKRYGGTMPITVVLGGLGICGTHLKSSIQDIVDEVAPIKKPPYGVEGRFIRM
jgi:hypothetical protein